MQTNVTQTSMHQNSLFNWENDIKVTLSERQRTVLNALRYVNGGNGATCAEVATYLGVLPHMISGRFGELKKQGLIKEVGTKYVNGRPHAILKAI